MGAIPIARNAQMIEVREQPAAVIKVHICSPLWTIDQKKLQL